MIASPSSAWSRASICVAFSSSEPAAVIVDSGSATTSAGAALTSVDSSGASGSSGNDDRLPLRGVPALGRLVLDALLEHDDALDERLGTRRATRHVDVDGDDLVDTFGDGVRVPVGTAAVRARTHGDDVLGIGHLLVETLD